MGQKNKIFQDHLYFLTLTVVDWVDVFTRPEHKHIIVDSLNFCLGKKGLTLYSWCLMSNHLHLIASNKTGFILPDILRDFKKHTSKKLIQSISNNFESRKKWMLDRFEFAGRNDKKIKYYKFWQDGNEAKELVTNNFMMQKLDYIHNNPVVAAIVEEPEQYLYSSARNYSGRKGLIDIEFLD